jgi:hypothetical protein
VAKIVVLSHTTKLRREQETLCKRSNSNYQSHGWRERLGREINTLKPTCLAWQSYRQFADQHRRPITLILATLSILAATGCAGGSGGVQPGLIVNPSIVSIADVGVGNAKTQTVTLTNTSDGRLTVKRSIVIGKGFRTLGLLLPISLVSGQSFSFDVQFAPNSVGSTSGNLSLVSDSLHSPVTITLSGSGVANAQPPAPSVTITVAPALANIRAGDSLQFTATVSGSSNTGVIWAVNGANGGSSALGTIDAKGLYIAPLILPSTNPVQLTVNSVAEPSVSAAAWVALESGIQPTQNGVSLGWNPDPSTVEGYYVYRGKQTGGPYAKISGLQPGTTYTDNTLTSGQAYYYVVTALDTNSLESSYSNEVEVGDPSVAVGIVSATTYYVANTGNNANVGTDPGHPFAFSPGMVGCTLTCAGVTLSAGDVVLFNRGDTWRDTLTTSVSAGVAGNPIHYGAYGTGANPIISGADLLTSWTVEGSNYFSSSTSVKPGSVLVDASSRLKQNTVSKDSLVPGQWFWESGTNRVYLRFIGDGNPAGHVIEGTQRAYAIRNTRNWLTFTNISTYGTTKVGEYEDSSNNTVLTSVSGAWTDVDGLLLRGGFVTCSDCRGANNLTYGISMDGISTGAHDITLNNPLTQHNVGNGIQVTQTVGVTINGGDSSFNGSASVEGNGISITSTGGVNAANITITNFSAHDNLGNGLSAFGDVKTSGCTNIMINGGKWYNNITGIDPSSGIRFDQNTNNSTVQYATVFNNQSAGIVNEVNANNNKILYNIVYGNHDGLAQSNGTGVNVLWYGNVSYNNTAWGFAHVSGSTSAIVKNNIFMSNGVAGYFTDGSGNADTVDFNDVFANTTNYSGVSKPPHDINSDPLFLNAAAKDFRIGAGSPVIHAGADLGEPYNLALDPRTPFPYRNLDQNSAGAGWDIGAFIYMPGIVQPPATPTGLKIIAQ